MRFLLHILVVLAVCTLFTIGFCKIIPSRENEGREALIRMKDTCYIVEEQPHLGKPRTTVKYRDNNGVWREESFLSEEITIIK